MQIQNLFPIPVAFFDLERSISAAEMQFVQSLETRPNMGNTTSVNHAVLRHRSMTYIRAFVEDSLAEYFRNIIAPKHDVTLKITQSWCNYSQAGQHHHKHAHPNSLVSGVFYLQTNANDRIYFFRDGFQQLRFPTDQYNVYNSETWWFEAQVARLMLFPSSLAHMVPTVTGDITRISLSFNTFPVGTVGEEMDLTALKLTTK